MESLGDSVVAGEAPHGRDLGRPGRQGLPQRDQLDQASLFEFHDGPEQSRNQGLTLLPRPAFLEQQVTEPLREAVDQMKRGMAALGFLLLALAARRNALR